MPRRSLSQLIVEALELAEKLNRVTSRLPPEIRETIVRYAERKAVKRGRRRKRRMGKQKQKSAVAA